MSTSLATQPIAATAAMTVIPNIFNFSIIRMLHLNELIAGTYAKYNILIIVGRPNTGKSWDVIQAVCDIPKKVLYLSFDMSKNTKVPLPPSCQNVTMEPCRITRLSAVALMAEEEIKKHKYQLIVLDGLTNLTKDVNKGMISLILY